MTDEQIRAEDCRLEVLAALHARKTGAHEATTIKSVFLSRRDYTLREIEDALAAFESMGLIKSEYPKHSAIKVWSITGDGITFKERGTR
jgi:hypothetical protein